jgi:hypothetical protein
MTQLSPFTSIFDKVAVGLSEIIDKKNKGNYLVREDLISDFNKLLSDAYRNVDGLSTNLELISQGEPPSSAKMNKFFSDLKNDINISSKQLDYLLAKTISVYNLFASEVENQKKYSNRIFSKLKILQIYSQSPAEDIVYVGDSFDNQDFLDFSKITQNSNPLVESGSLSIRINESKQWSPDVVKINPSNGIPGNNLSCIKKNNGILGEQYAYQFKDKASSSNVANIFDGNPLTIFEYEIFNVEKSKNNSYSNSEFSYIVDSEIIKGAPVRSLFDWSNHDLSKPLVLDFSMSSKTSEIANSIKITPYFGSSKIIKITSIFITDRQGVTKNIISSPIYIGSSLESIFNKDGSKYFLESATIRFPEVNALEIRVTIEQVDYEITEILHSYWSTNYSAEKDDSPFFGSSKFNPDTINRDIYQEISYSKDEIVAPISSPNAFSKQDNLSKNILVSLKKKATPNSSETIESYKIPIKLDKELLKAKKMSIGLRDVSVEHITLSDQAEIVSLPYLFDKPVESLMFSLDSDVGISSNTAQLINCYISVDDGKKWYAINPTQFGFNSSLSTINPEIFVFNQNTPPGYKLPGVRYLNAPEIPEIVNKILVKINIEKDKVTNMSPLIYGYTLATKVSLA